MMRFPLVILLCFPACLAFAQDTTKVEVQLLEVRQDESNRVPVVNFDLKLFNIFAVSATEVYYYYDSSFSIIKEYDEYLVKNINPQHIHKTSLPQLKKVLQGLQAQNKLVDNRVVLAQPLSDRKVTGKFFKQVFTPLSINQVQVGFISDELLTILKTIK